MYRLLVAAEVAVLVQVLLVIMEDVVVVVPLINLEALDRLEEMEGLRLHILETVVAEVLEEMDWMGLELYPETVERLSHIAEKYLAVAAAVLPIQMVIRLHLVPEAVPVEL
jgi:hypothetical protein